MEMGTENPLRSVPPGRSHALGPAASTAPIRNVLFGQSTRAASESSSLRFSDVTSASEPPDDKKRERKEKRKKQKEEDEESEMAPGCCSRCCSCFWSENKKVRYVSRLVLFLSAIYGCWCLAVTVDLLRLLACEKVSYPPPLRAPPPPSPDPPRRRRATTGA